MKYKEKEDLSNPLPSYEYPPIHEVVYGLTIEHLPALTAAYIGLFWTKIRSEFPSTCEAPYLFPQNQEINIDDYSFKRTWFLDKSKNYLIQLQNDRFIFNWRSVKEDDVYPRHDKVMQKFIRYLNLFDEFLRENELGIIKPKAYELNYINHIKIGDGWEKLTDVDKVIRGLDCSGFENTFLSDLKYLSLIHGYDIPEDNGRLTIKSYPAVRSTDETPILLLEITATRVAKDDESAINEWFKLAREVIVKSFENITYEDIQKNIWKKIENN